MANLHSHERRPGDFTVFLRQLVRRGPSALCTSASEFFPELMLSFATNVPIAPPAVVFSSDLGPQVYRHNSASVCGYGVNMVYDAVQ